MSPSYRVRHIVPLRSGSRMWSGCSESTCEEAGSSGGRNITSIDCIKIPISLWRKKVSSSAADTSSRQAATSNENGGSVQETTAGRYRTVHGQHFGDVSLLTITGNYAKRRSHRGDFCRGLGYSIAGIDVSLLSHVIIPVK